MNDLLNLIIDNGSYTIKAGFSHDEEPSIIRSFQFKVAQKYPRGCSNKRRYYEEDAFRLARMFGPPQFLHNYPKKNGVITEWNIMKHILEYIIQYIFRNPPEDCNLLLIDSSLEDISTFRRWTEMLFEYFNFNSFYYINELVPPLYALGKTTGIVINSGDSFTSTTPILNGSIIKEASFKIPFAGHDLMLWLNKLTANNSFRTTFEREEILYKIKEKYCFVSLDREASIRNNVSHSQTYFTEKNGNISIQNEQFDCPELLFSPGLFGFDHMSVVEMLLKSINNCDESIRNEMISNIVLSGGSTMFKGFKERIDKEMRNLNMPVNVIAPPERICQTWKGGRCFALQEGIHKKYITKVEYDEIGKNKLF